MDEELKQYLTAMEERIETRAEGRIEASERRLRTYVEERIEASEHRLVEKMRDMQSELLRGFQAFRDPR